MRRHADEKLLTTLLALNRAFYSIYRLVNTDIDTLIQAISDQVTVVKLRGLPFYAFQSRLRLRGFIYVSDLAQYVYCRRKFYLMYRLVNICGKIRSIKLRREIYRIATALGPDIQVYDEEHAKYILVGLVLHRTVQNSVEILRDSHIKTEVEVADLDLGVVGHIDVLVCLGKNVDIIEVKSGFYRKIPDYYVVQAKLYGLLVERQLGVKPRRVLLVSSARRGYGDEDRGVFLKLHQVEYREDDRDALLQLVRSSRRLLMEEKAPPFLRDPRRCSRCSFRIFCQYSL